MPTIKTSPRAFVRARSFALPLALSASIIVACSSSDDSTSSNTAADGGVADAKSERSQVTTDSGAGQCIACSLLLGFFSGDGGTPMGGMDMGGGGMDGGGGMPNISFCSSQVSSTFLPDCLAMKCAASCGIGASADGGLDAGSGDTDAPDGGSSCLSCLGIQCPADLKACQEDK